MLPQSSISRDSIFIRFEGGIYNVGLKSLAPGQSIVLDLRKIRDDKIADANGKVLPSNASHGQVHWSLHGLNQRQIIGRVEQVNINAGMSTTSACGGCCNDSYYDSYNDPSSATVTVGTVLSIAAYEEDEDCYGDILGPYDMTTDYSMSWSSDNMSVAQPTNCNQYGNDCGQPTNTVGPDTANINSSWTAYTWSLDQICDCVSTPLYPSRHTALTVQPTISGPNLVWYFNGLSPSGFATTITLTSQNGVSWSVTNGSNKITLSPNGSSATVQSSGGSYFSSSVGDISVVSTLNGISSAPFYLTTRVPDQFVTNGDFSLGYGAPSDTGVAFGDCHSSGSSGYLSTLHYKILDQLGATITNVPYAESFGYVNQDQSNSWPPPLANGDTSTDGTLNDYICQADATGKNPEPLQPQPTLTNNLVRDIAQYWFVGDSNARDSNLGVEVQDDQNYQYIDHGRHIYVASPPADWPH